MIEKCPKCNSMMEPLRIETIEDDTGFLEVWYCKKCDEETWIPYDSNLIQKHNLEGKT